MTTICLDFGNTRLKAAVFEEDKLKEIRVLHADYAGHLDAILKESRPRYSILSSVIAHDPAVEDLLSSQTIFHRLTNTSKLPFTLPIGKPETMGADRLAIAAAAVFFVSLQKQPGHWPRFLHHVQLYQPVRRIYWWFHFAGYGNAIQGHA